MQANMDVPVQHSFTQSVSELQFSPNGQHLAATSWDNKALIWQVDPQSGQTKGLLSQNTQAPMLSCAWRGDGAAVICGSTDNNVYMWNLQNNQMQAIGKHDAPVKEAFWLPQMKVAVTGSWDSTIRYWDTRQPKPAQIVRVRDRVYSMDVSGNLVTVAQAQRFIDCFATNNLMQPFHQLVSPLRMQTRKVANFADQNGFAIASIEGRVRIENLPNVTKQLRPSFAFRCHRHENNVYPVNCLAFHPRGPFATAGADGQYLFWDKDKQQQLFKSNPKTPQPITAATFNGNGSLFAYSSGYDWSKGIRFNPPPNQPSVTIGIHRVVPDDLVASN